MRILKRLLVLSVLVLALAACDGGMLPGTDPIHGEWAAPMSIFLPNLDAGPAEHRYTFRPDGTYESTTLVYQSQPLASRVVYEGETKGEYRLEPGGFAMNVQSWRWRDAGMPRWQNEVVTQIGEFGPPTRYTVNGNQLIVHHGPSVGEHGQPIAARDQVYTRRR
jgi:hypothetical protein